MAFQNQSDITTSLPLLTVLPFMEEYYLKLFHQNYPYLVSIILLVCYVLFKTVIETLDSFG